MSPFLHTFGVLSISYLVTAQSAGKSAAQSAALSAALSSELAAESAAAATSNAALTSELSAELSAESAAAVTSSAFVDPSLTEIGILQLITPTTHANQVPYSALESLSGDAEDFYTSYTQVDSFDFQSALDLAIASQPANAQITLNAGLDRLISAYYDAETSLLDSPVPYLSRLHASASAFPSAFSSSLMSQATGLLLGYESLASQDVLSKKPSSGPVTPGMSITVGPAVMSASTSGPGIGMAPSTSSSKAVGVPVATASPLLKINAAAAGMALLGVALM